LANPKDTIEFDAALDEELNRKKKELGADGALLRDENYFIYKENADLRTYYLSTILKTAVNDSLAKRRVFKALDAEKQYGKWNEQPMLTSQIKYLYNMMNQ